MQKAVPSNRLPGFATRQLPSDPKSIFHIISHTVKLCELVKKTKRRGYRIYYSFPATFMADFDKHSNNVDFSYEVKSIFAPHFSGEAPFRIPHISSWTDLLTSFQLVLVEITFDPKNS